MAWMNGSGILIWENVFGNWVGWSARDLATCRTMTAIQRQFHAVFSAGDWIPLSQESEVNGVYISCWHKNDLQLWTLINRNRKAAVGQLLTVPFEEEKRYFDLVRGCAIDDSVGGGERALQGTIKGRGIGCILSIPRGQITPQLTSFLEQQAALFASDSDEVSIPVKHNLIEQPVLSIRHDRVPDDMVEVPAISTNLIIEYKLREVGSYENFPDYMKIRRMSAQHSLVTAVRRAELGRFALDETPVTNAMYREFLNDSHYQPARKENFLKHWVEDQIPPGLEEHPVVYVDLDDARAYARWAKKRLPTEEEWQFAAEGPDHLDYPWGNQMEENRCNPNSQGTTTPVRAFPDGVSPFGCYDMCGNTWEWTSNVYSDGRTRFVMLKGGSCYKAEGSGWYPTGGPQKNGFINKFLLMWPGLDRCSSIGFRCVVDLG